MGAVKRLLTDEVVYLARGEGRYTQHRPADPPGCWLMRCGRSLPADYVLFSVGAGARISPCKGCYPPIRQRTREQAEANRERYERRLREMPAALAERR